MRTFRTNDTIIHYNSDFSENVEITIEDRTGKFVSIEIKASDLVKFVAQCYVLPRKLAKLEGCSSDEILGL